MATYLDSYISKLDSSIKSIEINVVDEYLNREKEIRQWIKERWLLGKRPDGSLIGYYRDVEYAIFKQHINPLADGDVDLIVSGALVRSIKLIPDNKNIEIIATDEKYTKIANKYGYDNFNITEKEQEILSNEIIKIVMESIFKNIWL